MKLTPFLATILVGAPSALADSPPGPSIDRAAYSRVLSEFVKDGRVDYARLAEQGRSDLDAFLKSVAEASLPPGRAQRIGLLIDAYNALVLRSVIETGRPRSVLDVDGFFDERTHRVAGRELTLDALEKQVLNPFAKDPRTHFVLVCGAVGCPILEASPYSGSDLDARMEAATRRYLASAFGARVEGDTLYLSRIFDWYAEDFGGPEGVLRFVRPRLPDSARTSLPPKPAVRFLDYNWTLNQR